MRVGEEKCSETLISQRPTPSPLQQPSIGYVSEAQNGLDERRKVVEQLELLVRRVVRSQLGRRRHLWNDQQ